MTPAKPSSTVQEGGAFRVLDAGLLCLVGCDEVSDHPFGRSWHLAQLSQAPENELDRFVPDIIKTLEKRAKYGVIISGYVAFLFGRNKRGRRRLR